MNFGRRVFCFLISLMVFNGTIAGAYDPKPENLAATELPQELKEIGITENLGERVDLKQLVVNEAGEKVPLGKYFQSKRPVIFSLVYFGCPGLCNLHLNGVFDGLKTLDWTAGNEFDFVALSFDSKEGPALAKQKLETYLEIYGRKLKPNSINFLTADEAVIQTIAGQVGFKFKWNPQANEWAHSSAAIMLTSEGVISRYVHGVLFDKATLKLAINEATNGKVGTLVDRMLWYCYKYDPQHSKYALAAFRLVQVGAGIMILVLFAFLGPFWWRNRRKKALI